MPMPLWACSVPVITREKDDRLLLRLINRFQPSRAAVWGGEAVREPLRYMQAGRRSCQYQCFGHDDMGLLRAALAEWGSIDFLYVDDAEAWPKVVEVCLPYVHSRTCIVVRNVGGSAWAAWQALIADERVQLSFDLYYLGVLCFDRRFSKQDYIINYT